MYVGNLERRRVDQMAAKRDSIAGYLDRFGPVLSQNKG